MFSAHAVAVTVSVVSTDGRFKDSTLWIDCEYCNTKHFFARTNPSQPTVGVECLRVGWNMDDPIESAGHIRIPFQSDSKFDSVCLLVTSHT